ncbi:MAG: inositol 2-dehydrogenase [Tateyamaria sp.]|jgi:myo-inositol 2-dehydrogenase/D-chiro-inositol 1-dehydrogenase|nr:inositol 2-dehydrogenase [Tateyamaria sp.]MBT7447384.1 inositol 2-dehydrogenase [Tateyamaria sp.]
MLNIGILGCGRIGQVHANTIAHMNDVRLTAVADPSREAAELVAKQAKALIMDPTTIVTSANVDAVIIATPTDTHFDLIHAAAKAGKAIFCEKPVDLSSKRIRKCINVIEETGVPFLTAFNRRFDPNFTDLQARLLRGEIGAIELVTIISRDPSPPPLSYIESSGGIFRDMMIHDFDMARFLLGEDPIQVYAVGSVLVDTAIGAAGDVDTAAVTLTTKSGAICQITNSRRATYGYDQRVEVHGSHGMLRAGNIMENNIEVANERGFCSAPTKHFFLERYSEAYRLELTHFVNAVATGSTLSPDITDGLRAQILADCAAESLSTGRAITIT